MNFKCDIKIYGIEERKDNILKNKEILELSDNDIFIKQSGDDPKFGRWPYKLSKYIFKQPVPEGITHRLVMQDDNELCPNFKEYLSKIINARPNDIIMLTNLDYMKEDEYIKELKSPYIPISHHVSGNALIIPVKYIDEVFGWLDRTYPEIEKGNPHEDAAFAFWAKQAKVNCISTIPSIVQHIGDESSLCDYDYLQRCAYFSDWDKADWSNDLLNPTKEIFEYHKAINTKSNIKYFVRTTCERKFDYSPLQYGKLIDYFHKPVESFINQLFIISQYNSVLLEDDLILCKDFQNEIEKVINEHPNEIIQFFTDPHIWETTFKRTWPFEWNQCTYYPKGVGAVIARRMMELKEQFPEDQKYYSQIENQALITLGIPHLIYRPCLVQHDDRDSILGKPVYLDFRRTTPFFKDYLDEAGIKYEDAYTIENQKKLIEIRNNHLK